MRGWWAPLGFLVAVAMSGCGPRSAEDPEGGASASPGPSGEPAGASAPAAGTEPPPIAPIRRPTCLPVARCGSFAEPRCALLRFDDRGTQLEPGPELKFVRVWPREEGVAPSITMAMDYFESERACRRRPDVEAPGFACALEESTCVARRR